MENLKQVNARFGKSHVKKLNINAKMILSALIFAAVNVILGQGSVFETLYPFGFGMIIASDGLYSFAALLGTSIGLLFSQTGIYLFRYLICAVTLWVIRVRFLSSRTRLGEIWFLPMGACLLVCSLTGVAVVLPTRGGIEEVLTFIAEAVIASFSSFFYKRSITAFLKKDEKTFGTKEMTCLYISFATLIAALASIEIYGFSPAQFISFFAIIVFSHILSESGGGICAASCATALSGALPDGFNVLPMIFSGIVSGVFSPLGKIGCAVSFVLTFTATSLFTGEEFVIQNIISAAIASAIFLAIPNKAYRKIAVVFKKNDVASQESTYRKDVSDKLSTTAKTVSSICMGMNKVSENLKKIDNNFDRNIFCRVKQEVCSGCESNEKCWNQSFQYTLRGFEELSKNYRADKGFENTPFTKLFLSKCQKNNEIKTSLIYNFKRYDDTLREEIRLDEKRSLMSDQMKCMSDILTDFSKTFSKCALVDNELSQKIKEIFKSFSIRCTKALCIIDTDGNMTIKVNCKKIDGEIDRKKLKREIEEASLRKFNDPEIDFTENGTTVIFKQKPWMKMKVGKIQLSSEESPICGDCLRDLSDEFGNRTIILSDGMGTGGRAAIDAAMTAEYFGSLIESSLSFDNALKIINSVLSVKSTNESLATIDAAHFNLFSGKVEFYKAGAAVSFVRKSGKCFPIESASLPAGILSDVSFAKEKVMLSKGDIVVMVSDGVTNYKTDWIIEEIENFNHSNPDVLAQKIAGTVCDKSRGDRRDDITVVVGIMTA